MSSSDLFSDLWLAFLKLVFQSSLVQFDTINPQQIVEVIKSLTLVSPLPAVRLLRFLILLTFLLVSLFAMLTVTLRAGLQLLGLQRLVIECSQGLLVSPAARACSKPLPCSLHVLLGRQRLHGHLLVHLLLFLADDDAFRSSGRLLAPLPVLPLLRSDLLFGFVALPGFQSDEGRYGYEDQDAATNEPVDDHRIVSTLVRVFLPSAIAQFFPIAAAIRISLSFFIRQLFICPSLCPFLVAASIRLIAIIGRQTKRTCYVEHVLIYWRALRDGLGERAALDTSFFAKSVRKSGAGRALFTRTRVVFFVRHLALVEVA